MFTTLLTPAQQPALPLDAQPLPLKHEQGRQGPFHMKRTPEWDSQYCRMAVHTPLTVHFVTARASLFADHGMSDLPMRAEWKHFKTMWKQTFDNCPTVSSSSYLNW